MSDDSVLEPQPGGALVPPPRTPPMALAAATPLPPIRPRSEGIEGPRSLLRLVDAALDVLDAVGDRVAVMVGLR